MEFRELTRIAEENGLRVFLFGGTAASFAHYIRWDMLQQRGDTRFQKERFNYDFTNIYKTTQDLDIVVTRADGKPESEHDIVNFQHLVEKRFPYMTGSSVQWEIRGLRTAHSTKDALLDNKNFQDQHTDSNSTGLIELTTSPESVVRDLKEWNTTKAPTFLNDVAANRLTYYYSLNHDQTDRARSGMNPPIFSVIRYLIKAFQFGMEISPEAMPYLRQYIREWNPQGSMGTYVREWIEKNGKKLFQNSVDIEYAWNTTEDLGLREKLLAFNNNPGTRLSLAWWMAKEPLRRGTHAKAQIINNGNWIGKTAGQTAGEMGLTMVAHETADFEAYETIIGSPIGTPKLFISRNKGNGENAAYGDGFYSAVGAKGAASTGFHIRFAVDPTAVNGVDFVTGGASNHLIWRNAKKLTVVADSLRLSPLAAIRFLADPRKADEHGMRELLKRKLRVHTFDDEDRADVLPKLMQEARKYAADKPLSPYEFNMMMQWFHVHIGEPPLDTFMPRPALIKLFAMANQGDDREAILRRAVEECKTGEEFIQVYDDLVIGAMGRNRTIETMMVEGNWDAFVRLNPSAAVVKQLKDRVTNPGSREMFAVLDLENSVRDVKAKGGTFADTRRAEMATSANAIRAMRTLLPLVKTAADFIKLQELMPALTDRNYQAEMETFLLAQWPVFVALHPTNKELLAYQKMACTSEAGNITVLKRALALSGTPGQPAPFAVLSEAISGKIYDWQTLEKEVVTALPAFLARTPAPTIADLKTIQKQLVRTEDSHMALVHAGLGLVETPADFLELVRFTDRHTSTQLMMKMERFVAKHFDRLMHMEPPPTAAQVIALQRSHMNLETGESYEFMEKALPYAATPGEMAAIVTALTNRSSRIDDIFLPFLGKFMAGNPTLGDVLSVERALAMPRARADLREAAFGLVKNGTDFAKFVNTSHPQETSQFLMANLEAWLLAHPDTKVADMIAIAEAPCLEASERIEIMTRALAFVVTADDFIKIASIPNVPFDTRKDFLTRFERAFEALQPTEDQRETVEAMQRAGLAKVWKNCGQALGRMFGRR